MGWLVDLIQSTPNSPRGMLDFTTSLLVAHGYLVILLGAAADNFGLPASGDVVLFAGGLFSNQGRLALSLVMLSGFAGALVSDRRRGGRPLVHRVSKMRFLRFLISEKSLGKAERYFESHGGKTVLLGRFGPGLRSMTPLFADVTRMKYYKFIPYNLTAAAAWAISYTFVGYIFGAYWSELLAVAKSAGYGFAGLLALILTLYALRRRSRRGRDGSTSEE